jgi:integrase
VRGSSEGEAGQGRHYLSVLASVLAYAQDLGLLETNPVPAFREQLRRRRRTKRGRAETQPGVKAQPVEDTREICHLVEAAEAEGIMAEVLVLLPLDAGQRLGEAPGLRWGSVVWGQGENDPRRTLVIDRTRPRGGAPDSPKSGRARRVALSGRLREALVRLHAERWGPAPDALVLTNVEAAEDGPILRPVEPGNFRNREWRRILKAAKVGHRALKDLRDTYAPQLLTAGVQLGYVSAQLGHADVAVTAKHYARWAGGETYRKPMALAPGEVPADFLARLPEPESNPIRDPIHFPAHRTGNEMPWNFQGEDGDPGRIRTCDFQLRRLALYPAELLGQRGVLVGRTGLEPVTSAV